MPKCSMKQGRCSASKDRGQATNWLSYGTLVTIHFRAKTAGLGRVSVERARVQTRQGILEAPSLVIEHRDIIIQP